MEPKHIVGLSGGGDSTALALWLAENEPRDYTYICNWTGNERLRMTEFGHVAVSVSGFHCDQWGVGPFVISVGDRRWRFEDSDRFGPALVKRNGAIKDNPYPPERSIFWWAHKLWREQGRRVADDGTTCVLDYRPKRPTTFKWVTDQSGRYRKILDEGDEGGGLVEVAE